MAATNNPLSNPNALAPTPVSSETHTISGLHVDVHGLSEVPFSATSIACLWLLHPRLQKKETMAPVASSVIHAWNAHNSTASRSKGLIALSFDQRNHGTRLITPLHNEAWRQGNPTHAQDMFSCYHGTAADCSQLIDHISSYIFHSPNTPSITQHIVLGISLGGHASWHCVLSDPRISAAVVGIGCPDYTRLMTDRARLSKLKTYTESSPPGAAFLGSKDFPQGLISAMQKHDPAGLLLPESFDPQSPHALSPFPNAATLDRFKTLLRDRLHGKHILNLSGRDDKLVPYAAGEPFLNTFKQAIREEPSLNIDFEDVLFDGVGHAFPPSMVEKAATWICRVLAEDEGEVKVVASKI